MDQALGALGDPRRQARVKFRLACFLAWGTGELDESQRVGQQALTLYLFNYTMPLIRYEVTDQLRFVDGGCACGSAHQLIADPQGRQDDCFRYGDLTVNAHVFRSVLGRQRNVVEYQARQTAAGADVAVRCIGPVDCVEVATEITRDLKTLGLDSPEITVVPVERLERVAASGKLKRFIPLAAKG